MTITFDKGKFIAKSIFDENEMLRQAGFKWDKDSKRWTTPDHLIAENLLRYCDNTATFQIKFLKDGMQKAVSQSASSQGVGNFQIYHPKTITPFPYQIAGVEYMLPRPAVILADEMGLGKEEFVENKIFTPTGRNRIGDVIIGDKVIGSDGNSYNVTGVFPQGKKNLYRVTFNDGSSVLVGLDHLWTVFTRNIHRGRKDGYEDRTIVLTTGQLLDRKLKMSLKGTDWNEKRPYEFSTYYVEKNGNLKWQIPIVKPINFTNKDVLPIEPYLLGLTLGDGHIRGCNVHFTIHKNDFDEIFKYYQVKEKNKNAKRPNVRICSINLKAGIEFLGLQGKKSDTKFIPDIYKYSSIDNRISILQGLMDTDGHCMVGKNKTVFSGTEYCTVSEQLADDVCEIVNSLGGIARKKSKIGSYTKDGVKHICKKVYRINIKMPEGINPFRLKRKADSYNPPKKYRVTRYIKDIKFEEVGEAVCIKVDAPDQLYVTEHGIVTHNTGQALLVMNMRNPVEALIVCPSILKYNWLKEARKWMIGKITAYVYESKKIRYYEGRVTNHNKNTILHIINYDILDKFKDRLLGTPFNFFVADECFVYDTLIETNIGSLKIGDVIDKRLPVKILSYNHSTKQTEYKAITRYIKHEKKYKNLVRVTLSNGKSLTCTEEHKFFVNGKYTKICEVKSGDNLFLLQGEVDERQKREIDCQILFNKMCEYSQQLNFIKEGVGINSILEAKNTNDLSVLPTAIYLQGKNRRKKEDVLLNAMFGEMENATARNITKNESAMERQVQAQDNFKKKTSGQSSLSISIFVTNEAKQSNDKSSFGRKNETENDRKNIFIKGWEWADNYSTKETARGVEFTRKQSGICHTNERSSFYVPISSPLLQSRYSDSRNEISNRSRWQISQNEKMEIFGQEENRNIECVRVESIKVLERGDIDGYRTGKDDHINLYDIEVEDNHNYFANDVLVSNCHYIKNQDAKRTKIAQELAKRAKWKIFITGTPIYNKPKDLYVALNLIDPAMFDNFFAFATRYCGARKIKVNNKSVMKYEGATNVDELNTILRASYMVRRMKKDVLKDLPEKIKDVIILNESDLDVLVQKEKKAVEDSKKNEEKLKAEAEELKALAVTNKEFENLYKDKVKTLREIKFKNFGELSRIRKEIAVKKVPYVIEFVKEILESSEDTQSKIVVFGHHKEVLYKIYEELKKYNPVIITGEVSDGERQRAIMLFKEKNTTRVFIGSMGAAGTGVDGLQQNCNTIVFAELDWTPALVDQAESRLQRIGQKNTVWVYHIVANESIDSRIVKLMMEKEAVSKEILDYRPEQIYDAVISGK